MKVEDFLDDDSNPIPINREIPTNNDGWDALLSGVCDCIKDIFVERPRISVSEWAEGDPDDPNSGAHIPATGGQPKPGRFKYENGPVMKVPANAFSDPRVQEITYMIGAQVGKSRNMQNMIGWAIAVDPGPMTLVYPNEDMAKVKMEEDFLPSIWATPTLAPIVAPDEKTGRDKGRKGRFIFPGGWIRFVSARSPSQVKGSPAKYVFIEEHAESVSKAQNSPDGLVRPRTTQFSNSKIVRLSTPLGSEKTCPTTKEYNQSDKSKPFVKCPSCGNDHIMEWENVKIGKTQTGNKDPDSSVYQCPSCGFEMIDAVRQDMIDKVEWRQTAKHDCCGIIQDPMETRNWDDEGIHRCIKCDSPRSVHHRGFWASVLYAKGVELSKVVRTWLDAQKDTQKLREFINQALAKNFEIAGDTSAEFSKTLPNRRIDYQSMFGPSVEVPPSVVFVNMMVDIQRDRLEFEIRGFAPGEESYGIKYGIIYGDPNNPDLTVWRTLDKVRRTPLKGVDNRYYYVSLCGIDIGDAYTAESALKYINPNRKRGVFALRGQQEAALYVPFDPTKTKQKYQFDAVGTDAAKFLLDARLRKYFKNDENPLNTSIPGAIHWPLYLLDEKGNSCNSYDMIDPKTGEILASIGYPLDYFDQLVNYKIKSVPDRKSGGLKEKFEAADKSVREEALDIMNYHLAGVKAMMKRFNVGYVEKIPQQWKTLDNASEGDAGSFEKFKKDAKAGGKPSQINKSPVRRPVPNYHMSGFGGRPGSRRG